METLQAEVRAGRGKGHARQLRLAGKTPAVLYGPGGDPVALSVDPKELTAVLTTPKRRNALIELTFGEQKQLAMVKDVQVHPVSRDARHVDFYRVAAVRVIEVQIPLRSKGRAAGVASGGALRTFFRTIPVSAKPADIPSEIMVDVSPLEMGGKITVADLALGDGVTAVLAPERVCMSIELAKIIEEEEPAPGAAPAAAAAEGDGEATDEKAGS
jgi:large subunit ribosomal protein L25